MKIPNKRELQQKASDHSSNIDFKPTRQGDVVATSQRRLSIRPSDVSNETPNDVSVVRRQDVSLVKDVLEEYRGDFLQKGNYEVTLLRPYDVKQVLNKTPNEVSKIRPKNVLLVSQSTKIYLGTTRKKIKK